MFPLLPFAAGLLAGAIGLRLLKTVKVPALGAIDTTAREQLGRAQSRLRQATVSGLSAVETSSARLRAKLTPEEPVPAEEAAPAAGSAPAKSAAKPVKAKAARKVRQKAAPPAIADDKGDA